MRGRTSYLPGGGNTTKLFSVLHQTDKRDLSLRRVGKKSERDCSASSQIMTSFPKSVLYVNGLFIHPSVGPNPEAISHSFLVHNITDHNLAINSHSSDHSTSLTLLQPQYLSQLSSQVLQWQEGSSIMIGLPASSIFIPTFIHSPILYSEGFF